MTQVKTSWAAATLLALGASGIFAGSAGAELPQQQGSLFLQTQANVRITFASGLNLRQPNIHGAGDVNGDGLDDLIVSAMPPPSMPGNPSTSAGAAFVIFGHETLTTVDPGNLGTGGFRIEPATARTNFGGSVSGAGDVNGDGLADVIIGAQYDDIGDQTISGSAYVIFGKRSTTPVSLAALGSGGFRIRGSVWGESVGASVADAGDINRDGLADIIVGAPGSRNNGWASGSAYVIFGKDGNTETVNLAELGDAGFRIDAAGADDWAGISVAGAGDVNGDGRPDVVVGAVFANHGYSEPVRGGSAYVVFGKSSTGVVELGDLANDGFRIRGEPGGDPGNYSTANHTGESVAGAGDVNGDRLADVIVGAPYADHNGRTDSGSAYVVYGKSSTDEVELPSLGAGGIRIDGAAGVDPAWSSAYSDKAGISVAGVGDVNGGGYDDVIVGAVGAYPRGLGSDGAAYVIYGGPSSTNVDLATLGARGFEMNGDGSDSNAVGMSVDGAGDFNGDGTLDVAVGSTVGSYTNARSHSAYVVYGFQGGVDAIPPAKTDPPTQTGEKKASGRSRDCREAKYENALEVPREAYLADLVSDRGLKVLASASELSKGLLKVEITGLTARYFKIYRSDSKVKSKLLVSVEVEIGRSPEEVYLKARGKTAKLIKRALRLKSAPARTKLKLSLETHAASWGNLERLNTQTVRALSRGKVKRDDTYIKVRQVVDRSECGRALKASIEGPRQVELSSLTSRRGDKGKGTYATVSCSEDCFATVGFRLWGRYEVGLGLRKAGQKTNRVLNSRTVRLKGGKSELVRLDGDLPRRLRKQLAAQKTKYGRYDRVKLKYSIEARSLDGHSAAGEGTSILTPRDY